MPTIRISDEDYKLLENLAVKMILKEKRLIGRGEALKKIIKEHKESKHSD